MSHTVIVGNITQDPELRFSPNGTPVVKFSIAENKGKDDKATTSFFDVVAFKTLAENIAESVGKGSRVIVSGRLQQNTWETPEGDKRSRVEILADSVGPDLLWATAAVTKNERPS